ncbi:MAG: glycosyltransferase, partial [Eggerthellaceae bacterium]|nr:glycosyltransferase [Eggerthellaceae bacterium]
MILRIAPERVRRRVILAPCWRPESVGIENAHPVSAPESNCVWDCKVLGEAFTYIVGGVGAGLCADIVMALGSTPCEELLFIGSAGALDKRVSIGDIVAVDESICAEGASRYVVSGDVLKDTFGLKSATNRYLTSQIASAAKPSCDAVGVALWQGTVVSVESVFMQGRHVELFQSMGASFIDMETSAVLAASRVAGISATAVFCVSDNQLTGKHLAEVSDDEVAFRKSVRRFVMPDLIAEFSRRVSVSVVVPTYNGGAYLPECVNSLLKDPPTGLEIIIVDDGSTDGTEKVADSLAASSGSVRVIKQSHGGLSSARNTGLLAARGEYVYFVDDDDLPVSGFIKNAYEQAKRMSLDLFVFSFEPFCESDALKKKYAKHLNGKKRTVPVPGPVSGKELFTALTNNDEYYPVVWIQLVKKRLLVRNSITFIDSLLFEDNLYSLAVMSVAERCA